jgi:hypothetical protein
MQYLVEGARGPPPASPEQAVALLEGMVIHHFDHLTMPPSLPPGWSSMAASTGTSSSPMPLATGTIVDVTIINAPSSIKNADKAPDFP